MGTRASNLARVTVLAVVALGCKRGAHPTGAAPKPVRAAPEKKAIPALAAEDEGLAFDVETTRVANPDGRRMRLLLGNGEVTLTLFDPTPVRKTDFAFGRGELSSPNRASGAAVVGAVARWLEQPKPAAPGAPGELRPFAFDYVRLGEDAAWQANKLFLQDGSREAEVFLNVRLDGKRAFLLEKDEDYRRPLVGLLATALRDGKPPRRTTGSDLAGPEPLVPSLSPIGAPGKIGTPQAWVGGAWLAVASNGASARVMLWQDLAKEPRVLADIEGSVSIMAASPRRDRVALLVLHPKKAGSMSSDDPGDLLVVPIDRGPARTLVAGGNDFTPGMLSHVVWSPDGAALAVNGRLAGEQPGPAFTRVFDVASGRMLANTEPGGAGSTPARWEGDTLFLQQWGQGRLQTLRWRPGAGEPTLDRREASLLRAPGGRYTVAVHGSALEISGPGGHRHFRARTEGDRAAVEPLRDDPGSASWIGGNALVLVGEAPMALDLAAGKMRYLFPEGDFQFMSASDDGGRVVARDRDQRLLWGRVAR